MSPCKTPQKSLWPSISFSCNHLWVSNYPDSAPCAMLKEYKTSSHMNGICSNIPYSHACMHGTESFTLKHLHFDGISNAIHWMGQVAM